METAAVSKETAVAEELVSYFVDIGNKDCFAASLYICFDLLRADIVAELVSNKQWDQSYAFSVSLRGTAFATPPTGMASWLERLCFPIHLASPTRSAHQASRARKGSQGTQDESGCKAVSRGESGE